MQKFSANGSAAVGAVQVGEVRPVEKPVVLTKDLKMVECRNKSLLELGGSSLDLMASICKASSERLLTKPRLLMRRRMVRLERMRTRLVITEY